MGIFMSTKTLTKYSVVAEIHQHDLTAPEHKERHAKIAELEKRKADKETSEEEKQGLDKEIAALREGLPPRFEVLGVTEYPAEDQRVHLRGDYLSLGVTVPRRLLPVISGFDQPPMPKDQSGRLELARWIASADNPLTARVIVNRLWRWHFGRGIVPTPDNFGELGERPTHPHLLDHLARLLVASGWSLKSMHREIMLSATYQQSSSAARELESADPENTLFARWQGRRAEAEVVRDSILLKSGRLDSTMGGSMLVAKVNKYADRNKLDEYAKSTRRTVYLPVMRSSGYDDQKAFDFPDPAMIQGDRRTSTVASQALFLMNSDLVHRSSEELAKTLTETAPGASTREKTTWLVKHILGRDATGAELERGDAFVADYGAGDEKEAWAAFARVLFASNEFLYIE